jgi:hypothetical protein
MARILYGVSGEGSGHSSRALEMGRHLLNQGHEVKLVSYDRGFRSLSPHFDTLHIEGLHIVSENNRVRPLKTVWINLSRARSAWQRLGQFEQQLNALCLAELGIGHHASSATAQELTVFFRTLPVLGEKVREYARQNRITIPSDATRAIRNKLDELLSAIGQGK